MEIVKCVHCDYLDFLNENPKKCPKCGAATKKLEDAFAQEKIVVKIPDTVRRKRDTDVTFYQSTQAVNKIIGSTLDSLIPEETNRQKFKYMVQAYVWSLLKKEPQLWLYISSIVNNIKDLITLKLVQDKNRYCNYCELKKESKNVSI